MSRLITINNYAEPTYQAAETNETDDQIRERINMRFMILEEMTKAVKKGDVRSLLVKGTAGLGKSFGVEKVLHKHEMLSQLSGDKVPYEIVKGAMSALMLYKKLWDYREEKNVLVLDDCDSITTDEVSLNILKAALDSSERRTISWNTNSRFLEDNGIPNSFNFEGGCIFITNLTYSNVRSKKLQDHLMALESRCHYLDLSINTVREKMLRIEQIVEHGMMERMGVSDVAQVDIMEFLRTNKERMRELSLRSIVKLCELNKSMPHTWAEVAKMTLLK